MRKMTRREQKILIVCGSLLFVYIFHNLVWKPFKAESKISSQKIRKGEKRLRKSLEIMRRQKAVLKEYTEYLNIFKQEMTDEEQMSSIIAQLEDMTQRQKLQFSEMKPQKMNTFDFYKVFPVSLKMDGSLDQVNQFLYDLQKEPYFFHVDKLRLEKKSRQKSVLKISLVLSKLLIF